MATPRARSSSARRPSGRCSRTSARAREVSPAGERRRPRARRRNGRRALGAGRKLLTLRQRRQRADAQHLAAELVGGSFLRARGRCPHRAHTTLGDHASAKEYGYDQVSRPECARARRRGDPRRARHLQQAAATERNERGRGCAGSSASRTSASRWDGGTLEGWRSLLRVVCEHGSGAHQETHIMIEARALRACRAQPVRGV